jgi:hypothetical protein
MQAAVIDPLLEIHAHCAQRRSEPRVLGADFAPFLFMAAF